VVDALGIGLDVDLGLDELAKGCGGYLRNYLKSDQPILALFVGVEYVECDAPVTFIARSARAVSCRKGIASKGGPTLCAGGTTSVG
jgi:hypothetical protein